MDNSKDDLYYIDKIKKDLQFIISHTEGRTEQEVICDEVLVDSIMFRIVQIAENNTKLSDEYKSSHKDIPWLAIKGMRNRIVHDYGVIDLSFIYDTVVHGIPEMYEKIKAF